MMNTIIKRFFNDDRVKTSINTEAIKRAKAKLVNNDKRKFYASLELGELAKNASAYFDSPSCKELRMSMGLDLRKDGYFKVSFGFDKSWLYKAIKAYDLGQEMWSKYESAAIEFQNESGKRKSLSIAELLKFAKNLEEGMSIEDAINPPKGSADQSGEGNGEADGESEGTTTHTFVDKTNGVNFRIDNGTIITTCDKESILASLTELMAMVSEM
jgi:hypothetical protein